MRLPPELAQAPAAASTYETPSAAGVSISYHVIAYRQSYLTPKSATVETGGSLTLVPYTHTRGTIGTTCQPTDVDPDCLVPMPLFDAKELPILNDKPGYIREWLVEDAVGGAPGIGTIAAAGSAGASYRAPVDEPSPNPVAVKFRIRNTANGRSMTLKSRVRVASPVWVGTVDGEHGGAADLGFVMHIDAIWSGLAGQAGSRFEANGTQSLEVINIVCTGTASPASTALPPGLLAIDRSVEPNRYTLDVGSVWNTTISGHCPDGSGTAPMTVPGRFQTQGEVSADGKRIWGVLVTPGISWSWSLEKRLP